jgi:hypothetical protein
MDNDFHAQLQRLQRILADIERESKRTLGFAETIEYMGITFNVSRRFVVADLTPLAFFHLVEHIGESAGAAVVNLYERLFPLLSCHHDWTPLKRSDERIRATLSGSRHDAGSPHICKRCTAYALGESLPLIGRITGV